MPMAAFILQEAGRAVHLPLQGRGRKALPRRSRQCAAPSLCDLTSSARFLKIRGKEVKITTDVITPAAKSAIPSDKYTPLKPRRFVSTKQSGIKMTTFLVTARSSADFA